MKFRHHSQISSVVEMKKRMTMVLKRFVAGSAVRKPFLVSEPATMSAWVGVVVGRFWSTTTNLVERIEAFITKEYLYEFLKFLFCGLFNENGSFLFWETLYFRMRWLRRAQTRNTLDWRIYFSFVNWLDYVNLNSVQVLISLYGFTNRNT